jgi:hypothetical protein
MTPDGLPPVPTGLQALLQACVTDPGLLDRLVARRSAAAREAGFALTRNEAATLDATDADQLCQMVAACLPVGAPLEGPGAPRRPDEREPTTGILVGKKEPQSPPRPDSVPRSAGISPDRIPRPGHNVVTRGIISGIPVRRRFPFWIVFLAVGLGIAIYFSFFRGP